MTEVCARNHLSAQSGTIKAQGATWVVRRSGTGAT